jgi:diguanylate cyclase (GGDEF)-like protein/PAS domain S-box-containing protein
MSHVMSHVMKPLSIRTCLLLLVLAVSAPLIALAGFDIYYDMQQTIDHTKNSLRSLMGMMVNNTENKVAEARRTLDYLAARPAIGQLDPARCDAALSDMYGITHSYTNIITSDLQGNLVCSALPLPAGKPINNAQRPWFREFMQRRSFTISEPYQGKVTGKLVSMISLPLHNARHEMIGGVHLPLDLAVYDPHIPASAVPPNSRYGFFAASGVMIWRNLDPEHIIGTRPNAEAARKIVQIKNGELESIAVDGVTRYFSVMTMPQTGWIAFIGVPSDAIYASAKRHALEQSMVVLLAIGLLWVLALLIARRISAPITELARTAQAVHQGNLALRSHEHGPLELARVAHEFNHMLDTLQQNNRQLQESEARYARAVNGANDGIWEADFIEQTEYLSPRWKQLLGYADHELTNEPGAFASRLHPDDLPRVQRAIQQHCERSTPYELEMRLRCKNGTYRWFYTRGQALLDEQGRAVRIAGSMTDITERKLAETELRIAATAFESQEGMSVTAFDGTVLRVNRAFSQITGYEAQEIIGHNLRLLQSGRHDAAFFEAMWHSLVQDGLWQGEIWNRRKGGEIYPEYLIITAVRDQNGEVTNYVGTFTDITSKKAAADEIMSLAFYDPLTHLPNRRLLQDRLGQALTACLRNGWQGGLLFIDLDNFKTLNDTLGHQMGDALLQQVAQRLTACVRESDTVARLGGDEFVVMLEGLHRDALEAAAQCRAIGQKILAALNLPYAINGHAHHYGASIGATLFCDHQTGINELLQQADIAMYQAKQSGRNLLCFFDPHMQTAISERATLEHELHLALERQQFCLHYQIQVDANLRPLGAEALLRWQHPERGMISPLHFIPLAEETGLILPIGQWVLDTACAQLGRWQQQPYSAELVLAVNVSAKQFRQADFVAQVKSAIARHAIDPARLKLELTESMLLDKAESIISTIAQLKALGLQLSLDDFGTGYSSLQYLKRLPLDQLKIDRSFVRDLAEDNNDKAIVRTIIGMAHSLSLDVIAEGVETDLQQEILAMKGCRHFQGYLFGKPMPIEQFDGLLQQDRS